MDIVSSYGVQIMNVKRKLDPTLKIYREAVSFLVEGINLKWNQIQMETKRNPDVQNFKFNYTEKLFHRTKQNKTPVFDFDKRFPKFPSYFRRAAISTAIGIVSSYRSNYANWEANGKKGNPPKLAKHFNEYPSFYNKEMYKKSENPYIIFLKVYHQNDWVWMPFRLLKTDVKYLKKHWSNVKPCSPVLEKKYGRFYLRFAFEEKVELSSTPLDDQRVCAVDLGINSDAVCSVMTVDGTVLARRFINFSSEKDHLYTVLNRIKKHQRNHTSKTVRSFWRYATHLNDELAKKIASAITDFAVENHCDVIVFEYLDFKGKRGKGSKKQRLHMWRKNGIQKMVEHRAHRNGIRISRVCAWGTSKLAFDGSGELTRDENNHALATFKSGKRYNCDLSASYNTGARYFIRALLKPIPVKKWSDIGVNIPGVPRRTLSTLKEIYPKFLETSQKRAA